MRSTIQTALFAGAMAGAWALSAPTGFGQTYTTNTYRLGEGHYTNATFISDSYARANGNSGEFNYDGEPSMSASNYEFPNSDTKVAFVAFHDLGLSSNAVVMKATLTLLCWFINDENYVTDHDGLVNQGVSALLKPFTASNVTAFVASSNTVPITYWGQIWAEKRSPTYIFDSVYDVGPELDRVVISTNDVEYLQVFPLPNGNTGATKRVSWTVTDGFAAQLAAGKEEYGFSILSRSLNTHDGSVAFRTIEFTAQATNTLWAELSPELEVIWYDGPIETLTLQVSPDDAWTNVTDIYTTTVPVQPDTQDYRAVEIE